MSIRRFFSTEPLREGIICIEGEEVHHIRDVNRLKQGAELEVTDGCGWVHLGRIDDFPRDRVSVRVLKSRFFPKPPFRLRLAVSLLKGKAMNFVLERLTEMGVDHISPILFSRTDVPNNEVGKVAKWMKISEQAIKVNDNPWLPKIDEPMALESFLSGECVCRTKVLLDLEGRRNDKETTKVASPAVALIGPPGGITDEERQKVLAAGFESVRICEWTMRSETAAMFAAAWLSTSMPLERET